MVATMVQGLRIQGKTRRQTPVPSNESSISRTGPKRSVSFPAMGEVMRDAPPKTVSIRPAWPAGQPRALVR